MIRVSQRKRRPRLQVKGFLAKTQDEAIRAAFAWQNDFTLHAPLKIESLVTRKEGDGWIASLTYRE